MGLADIDRASFSGHETFPFRYTWLKKAHDGVLKDDGLFVREDALVTLGVGKNMVKSMRHWGLSCGVLEEHPEFKERRSGRVLVGELGSLLFSDGGWDPYLEDPATTWLLHWQVVSTPERASTWYFAFNELAEARFTRPMLIDRLLRVASEKGWTKVSPASLKRDVDTFVRSYVPSRKTKTIEDTLDCPFVELRLLREGAELGTYEFVRGNQPTLPDEVFAYAMAQFLERRADARSTVSLEELSYAEGSPGRCFMLDKQGVFSRVERLADMTDRAWVYDDTAGLSQVHDEFEPLDFLRSYYAAPN